MRQERFLASRWPGNSIFSPLNLTRQTMTFSGLFLFTRCGSCLVLMCLRRKNRYAILGLTHQFTANLVDRERYDAYASVFADEVARLNLIPDLNHQTNGTAPSERAVGGDDRMIRPSEELRFTLFRHWNLYDSMLHSGYVAGKLKLWRDRGRRNLRGLLAKMGYVGTVALFLRRPPDSMLRLKASPSFSVSRRTRTWTLT
jgi:hypothetical protein